jgi:hypothetical protein
MSLRFRASRPAAAAHSCLSARDRLGDGKVPIRAVWNHRLTRLKTEVGAVELYRDDVRFERYQIGDAADLSIGLTIRPCCQTCVTCRSNCTPLCTVW